MSHLDARHTISYRVETCILPRVQRARAQGAQALRAAVERAVDYSLAVHGLEQQVCSYMDVFS
jgi:hypothetical protein